MFTSRLIISKACSGGSAACATLEGRDLQTFLLALLLLSLAPLLHIDVFKVKKTAWGVERWRELKEKAEHTQSKPWLPGSAELSPLHQESLRVVSSYNTARAPSSYRIFLLRLPSHNSNPAASSQPPFLFPQKLPQYLSSPSKLLPTESCNPSWRLSGVGDREGYFWHYKRWQTLTPVAHHTARVSPGPIHSSEYRLLCSVSPRCFQLQLAKESDLLMCQTKISYCLRACVCWGENSNFQVPFTFLFGLRPKHSGWARQALSFDIYTSYHWNVFPIQPKPKRQRQ